MTDSTPLGDPFAFPTATGTAVQVTNVVVPTGQFVTNTPVPLPGMPVPVAASGVTSTTPGETTVYGTPVGVPADQVQTIKNPDFFSNPIMRHFEFGHLPEHLQAISKEFHKLAHLLHDTLKPGPETSAGLRKLLEAKDCMVRAANEK